MAKTASLILCILLANLLLAGCQKGDESSTAAIVQADTAWSLNDDQRAERQAMASQTPTVESAQALPTSTPTTTPSPEPTHKPPATPTLMVTATTTPTATATPIVPCDERHPGEDLFAVVTKDYGISRDFEPQDLVPLADHLPFSVTSGYPTEIRAIALDPLVEMVSEMQAAGLFPRIESGYRSYAAQVIAWDKWNREYPESAAIVSAQPGHSEHQLGTVVDFGSPELAGIVGQEDIEFHTYFYKTSEGQWLGEHAHEYGFTLSFSLEAFETTGLYYEPWHFRYVGVEMASFLKERETTLVEYQLESHGQPCVP